MDTNDLAVKPARHTQYRFEIIVTEWGAYMGIQTGDIPSKIGATFDNRSVEDTLLGVIGEVLYDYRQTDCNPMCSIRLFFEIVIPHDMRERSGMLPDYRSKTRRGLCNASSYAVSARSCDEGIPSIA